MDTTAEQKGVGISGEVIDGRSRLGQSVPVNVFRALRLEGMKEIAGRGANAIIYRGGRNLGVNVGRDLSAKLDSPGNLNEYLAAVVTAFEKLQIGLVGLAGGSFDNGQVFVKVDECVTCAGIPTIGEAVCHFEGGVIAGIFQHFTGTMVTCKEQECWGLGNTTCLFEVNL